MDKYDKIKVVGRGAYGTVYLCRQLTDGKLVIMKQIPLEQMTADERQAALNEVKVLSMLDHPCIIQYYQNFLADQALMIIMEYAQGGTLLEYLQQRENKLLDQEEILTIFVQILMSMQHIHSKHVLHRDLKTQNILMNKKQTVIKIGDFGISKVLSSKSKAYSVVGTPCYISPELCEGKPYNQKSDIWALGCILYELASLKRAFEANNLPALVLKIMRGSFTPISDRYGHELHQLILNMLHLDPNKRPTVNQIMAQPIVMKARIKFCTTIGRVPVSRVNSPLSALSQIPGAVRQASRQASSVLLDSSSGLPTDKCYVFYWGNGILRPVKLPLPSADTQIIQVSNGRTQKACVSTTGRLIILENSTGLETMIPGTVTPTTPSFISRFLEGQAGVNIKQVSCGDLFTACITDRGILMTFGSGASGCLGHGDYNDVGLAKIVEALLGYEIVSVCCGNSHLIALTVDNELFAWGSGNNGRLGLGDTSSHCLPQLVTLPEPYQPRAIFCGIDCSVVITTEKKMLATGRNRFNKLSLDRIWFHWVHRTPLYLLTMVDVIL